MKKQAPTVVSQGKKKKKYPSLQGWVCSFGGHRDECWTNPLAWVAFRIFGATIARGAMPLWLAGSGKRTHLLYEIISNQIQHRMSPVWTDSGEAGLWSGVVCTCSSGV